MTFAERLAAIKEKFESGDTPYEIIDVLNAHVDHLIESRVAENALQVGAEAPLEPVFDAIRVAEPSFENSFYNSNSKQFLILNWFRGNW